MRLIERNIQLFCATGTDCENWELALDQFLTDLERNFAHHTTTTSYPDEPLEDVLKFAELWHVDGPQEVELIYVSV